MKLAASNIAWPPTHNDEAAAILVEEGATGVEIAPTKLWREPGNATHAEALDERRAWEARGVPVVAMQALLFGKADLVLFESETARRAMVEYLKRIIQLAGWLGCGVMVFGSPKNRLRGNLTPDECAALAVPTFRELGAAAADAGTCFCIEANPPQYGCDYIATAAEAVELVRAVGHPGFGLHLDAGGMRLHGEPAGWDVAKHFHISEPNLAAVGSAWHADYAPHVPDCWRSIEMRESPGDWVTPLRDAVRFARRTYG